MNKHINIELLDPNLQDYDVFDLYVTRQVPKLYSIDIRNIINKVGDRKINEDEVSNVLDLITVYLWQRGIYKIVIDIDERNKLLEPVKEMTLEEIEKKLGHKVKIVN